MQLTDILKAQGTISIANIGANIIRNGQNVTGNAIKSLELSVEPYELGILAIDYMRNLESGTPPNTYVTVSKINSWANKKGLWSGYSYRANTISRRIMNFGSKLYRDGGRSDVYTSEIEPLGDRILESATDYLFNIQIVE